MAPICDHANIDQGITIIQMEWCCVFVLYHKDKSSTSILQWQTDFVKASFLFKHVIFFYKLHNVAHNVMHFRVYN